MVSIVHVWGAGGLIHKEKLLKKKLHEFEINDCSINWYHLSENIRKPSPRT